MAHVLIVDDEPSIRFVLRLTFEAAGHRVTEASDGQEALVAIAAEMPDLVATDYMMPVMNGRDLIGTLRRVQVTAGLPVLLVSSSPGAASVPGADAFMGKPLDPREVVERAEALLEGRS